MKAKTLKLYDTLLNSLSHELRTPIATIIAATDNIQSHNDNLSKENKDELINEISKASFRLNQQVENLLNMSRLESGFIKPKLDWCDISELVYDTVKKIEENKIGQKIMININPDLPLVKTDKMLLQQIIYNLVNNATIYTKPGSIINIDAIIHADILKIIIEDNGKGFDPSVKRKGIGITNMASRAKLLNGEMEIQSNPGKGCTLTISIPIVIFNGVCYPVAEDVMEF